MRKLVCCLVFPFFLSGCSVIAVADAAVSVAATGVKVGAKVVETAVDLTASGVKKVTGSGAEKKEK